jgi:hypothetical protein
MPDMWDDNEDHSDWPLQKMFNCIPFNKLKICAKQKELPMLQVDIFKLNNIESVVEIAKHIVSKGDANEISEMDFTRVLQGHAKLTKRAGESIGAAFERILTAPENTELRKAYRVAKGMASLEPTSAEVGSSENSDDSAEAVRLLQEMATKNGRSFESVFTDPANAKLAARTYPYRVVDWHSAAYK